MPSKRLSLDFRFTPHVVSPREAREQSHYCCIFSSDHILLVDDSPVVDDLIRRELFPEPLQTIFLGVTDNASYSLVVVEQGNAKGPAAGSTERWVSPRMLVGQLPYKQFEIVSRAIQLRQWYENHRYCCRCGAPTQAHDTERMMECVKCHYQQYPRISPCIIVLIHREDEVLLARNSNFPPGLFSTLAGFIEAGESVEHALQREVREEVGLEVGEMEYRGSQSWPFPHSLMLGYHARWLGGEISVDNVEITEANWWKCDELPLIPPEGTISRFLIDDYVTSRN